MFNVICSMIMIYIDPPLEHPPSQASFVTETIPFQCCRGELLLRILSTQNVRRISLCVSYFIGQEDLPCNVTRSSFFCTQVFTSSNVPKYIYIYLLVVRVASLIQAVALVFSPACIGEREWDDARPTKHEGSIGKGFTKAFVFSGKRSSIAASRVGLP